VRGMELPLSFAQERVWFLHEWEPESSWYNVPIALRLSGSLQLWALQRSLSAVVQRLEVLRTTFAEHVGRPVQIIAKSLTLHIPVIDLRDWERTTCEQQVSKLVRLEAERSFDLSRGPLLRACLLWLDEQEYVLLFTLHHIITDGWSIDVLVRDMTVLYQAQIDGQLIHLPALPIQYADYTLWQRQWLQGGSVLEAHIAYWKRQLRGAPAQLKLPTDRPRLALPSYNGASVDIHIPASLTAELKSLSQHEGVTLFMTLLTAFQALLSRYAEQEDIVVGTDVANRTWAGVEELIGFFVNQLALRTDLSGNPTFLEVLQRVKHVTLGAYTHQDLPFEKLVEVLNPERSVQYAPLFQVKINFVQGVLQTRLAVGSLHVSPLPLSVKYAKQDIELLLHEGETGIRGNFTYNTALFDASTIKRLSDHFLVLLENVVKHPDSRISTIDLLTAEEKEQQCIEEKQHKFSSLRTWKQAKPKSVRLMASLHDTEETR